VTISVEELLLASMAEIRETLKEISSSVEGSREDASKWRQMAESRMSTLEAEMKTVLGNGQPGRLTIAELAVDELKLFKAQAVAIGAAIGGLIGMISATLGWLFPRK
jgi:ElaB/YqjD/DUF883 family membrane-anchored ribosome-binding protein